MPQDQTGLTKPEFLGEFDSGEANSSLTSYIRPPRLKIVQGTAKPPISERYNPGDVCFVPSLDAVVAKAKPFYVTPLFFFPEWMTFNPMGAEQVIRERTFDPRHPIAVKSRKKETRKEPCPETPDKFISHNAFLNFICVLMGDHEFAGTQFVMSFKGAEYKTGSNLGASIKMRQAAMFTQVYEAKTAQRTNDSGTWWGLDIGAPSAGASVGPWVPTRATAAMFKQEHDSLKEAHAQNQIIVEVDDGYDEAVVQNEDLQ